ncbi:hypothetical protein ANCDUO_23438 [Ancylostoma duodenale]|uniref:Protein-tyrosine phosphatase n=1 Tax=Ancylostoma duodenale TaxID=51022 RepID=A0A0C2FIG7_9BILA|nr:hypothetical protein ANCDUO_23438 [Ancylostoma duodenale]
MNWPDRGVPPTNLSSFRLLTRVKLLTPIVVHCSAGIGRTGAIVGLDLFYSKLQKGVLVIAPAEIQKFVADYNMFCKAKGYI